MGREKKGDVSSLRHGISCCPLCGQESLEYTFQLGTCNNPDCGRRFYIELKKMRLEDEAEVVRKQYEVANK